MKICVLTGSPKGKNSITYQTVLYLEGLFPHDTFTPVHVGARIRSLEKDLTPALNAIREADLLLFCYPVYTFISPYQLQRFIELLKESGENLRGKMAAQITTSKHFYDVTAHRYIEENCADMGLRYVGGLSADMDDLTKKEGQHDAESFWELVHFRAEHGIALPCHLTESAPLTPYVSSGIENPKRDGHKVVIVADLSEDAGLSDMIADFRARWPHESRVVDLGEYPFGGGCLGCFNCAVTGKCVYKDGFDEFLRNEIQTGDAIVYAFTIRDHSMGSRMKLYDDRQFCNGHRTVTAGMPMGYLIRGDLTAEPNLRMIIEGRGSVGGNYICGTATDPDGVAALVDTLEYALDHKLTQPANFLGVGGMKIFRDLIWLMRGMMKADHEFYREHGLYDFPQKQVGTVVKMKLVGALITNPKLKSKVGGKMTDGMLLPYRKVLNRKK